MLTAVIVLACIGILLIGLEFILPGGIAGGIGAVLLVLAIIFSFMVEELDAGGRGLLASAILVATIAGIVLWFRVMSSDYFASKFGLKTAAGMTENQDANETLVGLTGAAKTVLRPSGKAIIEGKAYDVTAEGGMIGKGDSIKVVKADGMKIVVRRHDQTTA